MHKLALILCFLICLSSCKSSKKSKSYKDTRPTASTASGRVPYTESSNDSSLSPKQAAEASMIGYQLVDFAKQFEGVRYKYGGTTKKGMDCSGLVYETYKAYNINLPRVSRDMAKQGKKIKVNKVQAGDLLFFHTNPKHNTINHVGLVVSARIGQIRFIHSTSSKGVITSSLEEQYWNNSFKEARRIL